MEQNKRDPRCLGCKWHMPQYLGGQGMLCYSEDGKCPGWVIKNAINFGGWRTPTAKKADQEDLFRESLKI